MKLSSLFAVSVAAAVFTIVRYPVRAEEPTASPAPSAFDAAEDTTNEETTEGDATKEVDSPSPDEKFAFLIGRGEDEKTVDLIDKKTEKVLQHIDDSDIGSVSYSILWAPD